MERYGTCSNMEYTTECSLRSRGRGRCRSRCTLCRAGRCCSSCFSLRLSTAKLHFVSHTSTSHIHIHPLLTFLKDL